MPRLRHCLEKSTEGECSMQIAGGSLLWVALVCAVSIACMAPARAAAEAVPGPIPPESLRGAKTLLLWPDGAPGAAGDKETDKPSLIVCPVAADADRGPTATGVGVVVCPGGGYGGLAIDHEGYQVAQWLNEQGISAFILKYRVAPYRHPIPLHDAQRALRTVRLHAKEWNAEADRIGILGFSAGGHLASSTGTHFDKGNADAPDPIDRVSCRPDFMVLIYPVITFKPPYAHMGSRQNLLGKDAGDDLVTLMSNDEQVTAETPPTFLVHTTGDTGVRSENSIQFYLALRKAGVPGEMHIYEKGEHGFGLAPNDPVLGTWPRLCIEWIRARFH